MPETPDFARIARELVARGGLVLDASEIAEALRQIWNARGAADLAAVESSLSSQMGATAAGPYLKNLDRALRHLDR